MKILAINPGSTSTKIAVYDDTTPIFKLSLHHSAEELADCTDNIIAFEFRTRVIEEALSEHGVSPADLDAVVGRGGLTRPLISGTYIVNDAMIKDLRSCRYGDHACNLAADIAKTIGNQFGIPAYIADPPVSDEFEPLARLSGLPEVERVAVFHVLNQKAVSKRYAKSIGRSYNELNLIVAHMGGGVTVGAHKKGKVVDCNNGLHGDGPYSAERCGSLPARDIINICFDGRFDTPQKVMRYFITKGGLAGYLGTNDGKTVSQMVERGDQKARLIYEGLAYQTAKEIGAAATVLKGEVDAIILTGGLAYDKLITDWISERTSYIAPAVVIPGEDEMIALVEATLRVLNHEEEALVY